MVAILEEAHKLNPQNEKRVMIGGALFFIGILESTLTGAGWQAGHTFSERVVEENPETGEKESIFVHQGFYWIL